MLILPEPKGIPVGWVTLNQMFVMLVEPIFSICIASLFPAAAYVLFDCVPGGIFTHVRFAGFMSTIVRFATVT